MKKFLFGLTAMLIMALASCSSDKTADAGDLIATVPSDASFVATLNLGQILDKSGCKVDGSKITPPESLADELSKTGGHSEDKLTRSFLAGKSGIDPTVAVIFRVGYYTYLTGVAADPTQFKAQAEKDCGQSFTQKEGFDVAANIALADNQFWINLDQPVIDPVELKHFKALDKAQSFASIPAAEKLTKIDTDMEAWANIQGLLNTATMTFQDRASVQVALQTLFDDPANALLSVNTGKGTAEITALVVNSKGNPAKFLIPTGTVDIKTVEALGGNAELVIALDVPGKMIKKLQKETASQSSSVFGLFLEQLNGIDGTIALAVSPDTNDVRGVVATDGNNTTALTGLLGSYGFQTTKEGNLLKFSMAAPGNTAASQPSGFPVADLAKNLKGAAAGVSGMNGKEADQISNVTFTLRAHGDGMKAVVKVTARDQNQNILTTLVDQISK